MAGQADGYISDMATSEIGLFGQQGNGRFNQDFDLAFNQGLDFNQGLLDFDPLGAQQYHAGRKRRYAEGETVTKVNGITYKL